MKLYMTLSCNVTVIPKISHAIQRVLYWWHSEIKKSNRMIKSGVCAWYWGWAVIQSERERKSVHQNRFRRRRIVGPHCREVCIVADGLKLSAAKGRRREKREKRKEGKKTNEEGGRWVLGVVRIPGEPAGRSVDHSSTLPGPHCRSNAIHWRTPWTPHGDPGEERGI